MIAYCLWSSRALGQHVDHDTRIPPSLNAQNTVYERTLVVVRVSDLLSPSEQVARNLHSIFSILILEMNFLFDGDEEANQSP
jgi:hypothetical protein